MYTFRNATDEERKNGIPISYGDWISDNPSNEQFALFFGKVRTLFGVNDSISDDWENMYHYLITAEDENGNKLYFLIYGNRPAIGVPYSGELTPDYEQAKTELLELIENTLPADYVWEGCYYDVPVNIKYTVKDGKARVDSEFPAESEEDYE